MNISKEDKKAEAVRRMELLGIFPETIRQFADDDYVSISDPPYGAFYWIDGDAQKVVHKFEQDYNALVYIGVRAYTKIGKMDAFLYVSDHKDEWAADRVDLTNKEPYAYVVNWDNLDCSEIGVIGIEGTIAAGLRRTW